MPYLDIVFQNIRQGGQQRISDPNSRAYYTSDFPGQVNVGQVPNGNPLLPSVPITSPAGGYAPPEWGQNIVGANGACSIFFAESSPYPYFTPFPLYNPVWWNPAVPGLPQFSAFPLGPAPLPPAPDPYPNPLPPDSILNSFTPSANPNYVCAFLEGFPDAAPPPLAVPLAPASPNWLLKSNPGCPLQCIGTGDPNPPLYGAAPPGSDRYAIYFQATNRTMVDQNTGNPVPMTGLFVHTKNTDADPGTQIAALCSRFENAIIFGDLNLNIKNDFNNNFILQSLNAAINRTHTVLAIQQDTINRLYYATRGGSCLDYALVPNKFSQQVALWAYRPNDVPMLYTNGSDHSVMMLRILCN